MKFTPIGKIKGAPVFPNIDVLKAQQLRDYEDMKKESSDRVQVISGYEGTGKSYLQLELHENWTMDILGVKDEQQAFSTFCFQDADWAKALMDSKEKEFMMITHDEAVNILYRKEGATKVNKEINKAFKKFRGKKWYHTMIIPQIHRMDKEMVEDRVRSLLFVSKIKGKRMVAFYPKTRLDSLISEINRMIESTAKDVVSRPQVSNCNTQPAFYCIIPEYKGRFLKYYADKKANNMDASVDAVFDVIASKLEKEVKVLPKDLMKDKGLSLLESGKNQQVVADTVGVSIRTVQRWVSDEKIRNMGLKADRIPITGK